MVRKPIVEDIVVSRIERECVDKYGRRWGQDHERTYDTYIERYATTDQSPNRDLIVRYLTTIRLGDRSKKCARKVVSKSRCLRILGVLRQVDEWLGYKPFLDVTEEDLRRLVGRLEDDILKSARTGHEYKDTTKATIRKVVKKFWKHLKGEDRNYPREVDWIDTYEPVPNGASYTFEELELVRDGCNSWRMKTFVWLLFDTGVRINEMLNLRISDIYPPTKDEKYYVVNVRDEIAKDRRGRRIGLFLSSAYLKNYIEQHHPTPDNPRSFLFPYTEDSLRSMLYRIGRRVLRKSITPHAVRRSSASFFGVRIKSFQTFCHRFGWSLHSRTADKYFRRGKVSTREAMQDIVTFEREQLQNHYRTEMVTNHEMMDENYALKEHIRRLEAQVEGLVKKNLLRDELQEEQLVSIGPHG